MEAGRDGALADHRELRVDVDGARPRHEEEARLEVLQVVDRERVEALSVHREHPAGEEARVVREEPGRVRERRFDVSARVAHDERVAVEDLHEPVVHAAALFRREDRGPGKSRCMRTRSRQSPSTSRSPRRTAATAFSFPPATLSKIAFVRTDDAVRVRRLARHADVSVVDRHVPAVGLPSGDDVEPRAAIRLSEQSPRDRAQRAPRRSARSDRAAVVLTPSP